MGSSGSVLSSHRANLNKEGKKILAEFVKKCTAVEMADDERISLVQAKVDELLTNYPLPKILFIDFLKLTNGTFPRCPDDKRLTTELDSIDRDNSFMVFVSHCWLRGYAGAAGWDGRPHPDNATNDKFALCWKGIKTLKEHYAPQMKHCYVWLDFACINQDGNPAGELEQLDKIVQCCDCIFTPIVDYEFSTSEVASFTKYDDYKAKLWNQGPHAYLNRGWCRVEMLYAATIPVLENKGDVPRHSLFEAGLAYHCSQNRRPHFLYGTTESLGNLAPLLIPPLQHSYLQDYHPLKGSLSVDADREHISALVTELQPYMDENLIEQGYHGEVNDYDEKHGYGTFYYDNGDVYEGEWHRDKYLRGRLRYANGDVYDGEWADNKKHGHGVLYYANGDVYEGKWENDSRKGHGSKKYANGDAYQGHWDSDLRHGQGTLNCNNGDIYEGDWEHDKKHGSGKLHYSNGDVYHGDWERDKRHGQGTHRHACGDVYDGEWKFNKKHGHGRLQCANGEVYQGQWECDKKH